MGFQIDGENINCGLLHEMLATEPLFLIISDSARSKIQESRSYIEAQIASGHTMYGVNTGFGAFSSIRISDLEIEELQRNLIRSHSVGIGEPLSISVTKALMILRANTLSRGHSGVRLIVIETIVKFLEHGIYPVIPSQGSVGASGDLAPLSHLALALIGEGEVWYQGQRKQTEEIIKKLNIEPLILKAKEGLSLINGCQVMTSIGLLALKQSLDLLKLADLAAAMTLEATRGSRKPYDPLIAATRPHPGEAKTASNLRKLLGTNSTIADSHQGCHKVQDAYSLRCVPAVHGAVKDVLVQSLKTLEIEANSSTDNPLVFAKEHKVLSCGNFHGEPVALAMDFAGIALANLGNISERRIAKLIDPNFSELPAFLTSQGGLQSGFMIVQVAAASLVSENKILAHPASVDSIPTSSDKEDHVSMGTIAARKFEKILQNVKHIIAMELLGAAQGLDMLKPLKPDAGVLKAFELIRAQITYAAKDRVFSYDIHKMVEIINSEKFLQEIEEQVGGLQC
jgi:histidine ammonia-lyase